MRVSGFASKATKAKQPATDRLILLASNKLWTSWEEKTEKVIINWGKIATPVEKWMPVAGVLKRLPSLWRKL